jgi:hypothetical protein
MNSHGCRNWLCMEIELFLFFGDERDEEDRERITRMVELGLMKRRLGL